MRGRILVGTVMIGALALVPLSGSSAATKPEFGYIADAINFPTSSGVAEEMGRDIDGNGHKDNALGLVIATMSGQGVDMNGAMSDAITSGEIVMLHSIRSFSLANSKNATWQVWYGEPTLTPPDLSGAGTFELPADQPHSGKLATTIKDHFVRSVAGKVPLRLDIGADPFLLNTFKTKLVADCYKSSCTGGRITGAVSQQQVDAKVIPELAQIISIAVDIDCDDPPDGPIVCEGGSTGQTLVGLFDKDGMLPITADELRQNDLIDAVLAPDLDLKKADGTPGTDGVKESLSFGFTFTTVKAKLTRP